MSRTRKPDGGTKSIPSPSDYSDSHRTEFDINHRTDVKEPYGGPSQSKNSGAGAGSSTKGKAPPPPTRSPPPRKKHPTEPEKKKESKA